MLQQLRCRDSAVEFPGQQRPVMFLGHASASRRKTVQKWNGCWPIFDRLSRSSQLKNDSQ